MGQFDEFHKFSGVNYPFINDDFHWKFTLACQNRTFQAFAEVYKNGHKTGAIKNFAKFF